MSTTEIVRTVEGRKVPGPGRYVIDPAHSSIEAIARHMMVTKVRGYFEKFSGTIEVAEDVTASSVEVTIDAATIDTREPQRDAHLKSPDFLDVERFPELRFRSTAVRPTRSGWEVDGELTIRDMTRPVTLAVTFEGAGVDPFGNPRAMWSATTQLDREEYGITWNQALETGGVLVGKKLQVELDISAIRQDD